MPAAGIVGRDQELETLRIAAERASAGALQVVVVCGDGGIGKSALIESSLAEGSVHRVLAGRASPVAGPVAPFSPWALAFGRHGDGTSFDDQGPSAGHDRLEISKAKVLDSWLQTIRAATDEGPITIVLEDVHWADAASLDLLMSTTATLADSRILLIASVRTGGERGQFDRVSDELFRRSNVEVIELGPLTDTDLTQVITRIRPALARDDNTAALQQILADSNSNTFWATELAKSFPEAAPLRLRELIIRPFERLTDDARRLIELLAVAARALPVQTLQAAMPDLDENEFADALTSALSSGIVARVDSALGFQHGIASAIIHDTLASPELACHHRSLAEALSAHPDSDQLSGEIAEHWFRSGVAETALDACTLAGVSALSNVALQQAELHLSRAMLLWERSEDRSAVAIAKHVEVIRSRAETARWAGDLTLAMELIERALTLATDSVLRARLQERLGRFRYEAGDASGAEQAYAAAARSLQAGDDSVLAAQIAAARASLLMLGGHPREAIDVAAAAVETAEAVGAERQAAYALSTRGTCRVELGDVDQGMRDLLRSQKIARRLHDVEAMIRSETCLCLAYDLQGRLNLSREAAARAFEVSEASHLDGGLALSLVANLMELDWMVGEWDRLDALAASPFVSGAGQYESFLLVVQSQLRLARGQLEDAATLLTRAELLVDHTQPVRYVSFLLARSQLALWQGEHAEASGFALDAIDALKGTEEPVMLGWSAALSLRAAADTGRARTKRFVNAPRAATDALAEIAHSASHVPQAVAWMWTGRGETTRLGGAPDPEAWAEAARRWEHVGRPYEQAYAQWRMGEALAYRGNRSGAVDALTSARAIAERLGATLLLNEIEVSGHRARLLRVDLPSQMPAPFGALSRREFEILTMIATGLSNKQIGADLQISDRTVAVHVSNLLKKIHVGSRTEAAMLAERAGIIGEHQPEVR